MQLSYNVLLVILCTFYAVRTRRLPDNFNESRFISFCAYTTVIMWMAFIPTYFASATSKQQVIILSTALLINASVMLLCLFVPKLYALYFVEASNQGVRSNSLYTGAPRSLTLSRTASTDDEISEQRSPRDKKDISDSRKLPSNPSEAELAQKQSTVWFVEEKIEQLDPDNS